MQLPAIGPGWSDVGAFVDLLIKVCGILIIVLVPFGRMLVIRALKASKAEVREMIDTMYAPTIEANAKARISAEQLHRDVGIMREAVQFQGEVLQEVKEAVSALKSLSEQVTSIVLRMDERDRIKGETLAQLLGRFEAIERQRNGSQG